MWHHLKLIAVVILIVGSEARPKKYSNNLRPIKNKATNNVPRLATDVVPVNYLLKLNVDPLTDLDDQRFTGHVEIQILVNKKTNTFQIHAKNINIDSANLNGDQGPLTVQNTDPDKNDVVTITVSDENGFLEEGKTYTLILNYEGKLSSTDMDGFYKSSYQEDHTTKYLATTQFEQFGARRAFPCFDEPNLKATFDISITHPKSTTAISNTPPVEANSKANTDLITTTFVTTPKMSTYLIAFIVSEFKCIDYNVKIDTDLQNTLCARVSAANETFTKAEATAPKSVQKMEDFTSFKYSDMTVKKLTQAAIPDFSAGAMENWGLLTYREVDLLWDESQSSSQYEQAVATVVTHELSHQWFGDLVTLDWWSNIFLNEGFATFFEYHATDEPEWELLKQFVVDELQPVLLTDSNKNAYPLSYETTDPDEIESRFDDISYNKGGSIIRMIQRFLGDEVFKSGLNKYLNSKQFDSGTVEALLDAFQSAVEDSTSKDILPENVTVPIIADNWIRKPGYPLLSVTLKENSTEISQKRFLNNAEDDDTQYYVPVTYTQSNKLDDFANTTTQAWLLPDQTVTLDVAQDGWILLNNQQVGYYRVDYDKTLLDRISKFLSTDLTKIDEISRSQLIDDQLNLARAGYKKYNDVLRFLSFLKQDDSYYSWKSAFAGFNYLLQGSTTTVRNQLRDLILDYMDALKSSVPIEKLPVKHIDKLKRVLANTWACNLGDKTCLDFTKTNFQSYVANDSASEADLKSIVYCNGLRQSDNATGDFSALYNKYLTHDLGTEQVTILRALGCINNSDLRKSYLNKVLENEIRIQDVRSVFAAVVTSNPEAVDDVIDFVDQLDYPTFYKRFKSYSYLQYLINLASSAVTSDAQVTKLTTTLNKETFPPELKANNAAVIANANNKLNAIKTLESDLRDFFKNSASINTFTFVNLFVAVVVYLFNSRN